MNHPVEMPAPWRAWALVRRGACPEAAVLRGLNTRLAQVYDAVGPGGPDGLSTRQRLLMRRLYLRTPADLRRVRRYVAQHAEGVRATLQAARFDPDAASLLGPEALVILERLDADPFGLRDAWPGDEPLRPLLALADANARPFDD